MADPKYDKLYGIARDQPDVYETSDLPEADQPGEIYEEKSDAVERLHISASEAFSKFQGKEVDAFGVDFSDRIGRKNTSGYNIRGSRWELAGLGEKETPLQTYDRLKLEIEQLVEEVSNTETAENCKNVSYNVNVSVEASQQLYSKLVDLKLEDKIGLDFGKSIEHPEGQQFSKVINYLSNLKRELKEKPNEEVSKPEISNKDAIQVMLKCNPSKQMHLTSRLTDLEQKLGKLESLVGINNAHAVNIRLCNVNTADGLINCCQWMIAKLSLLDSSQLDSIESKLINVNSRIEQCINAQNSLIQDPEKEKKVNELYEVSERTRGNLELIPNILERMIAIESMHKQGKQCVQMMLHVEALQTELSANLATNKAMLNNVKDSLNSNFGLIKNNVESLKSRIDALMATKK